MCVVGRVKLGNDKITSRNVPNKPTFQSQKYILFCTQESSATLLKVTLLHGCFSGFLNCTSGTKSRNAPQIYFRLIQVKVKGWSLGNERISNVNE